MASAIREMFTDSSTLSLISIAVFTAGYASVRANEALFKQRSSSARQQTQTISEQLIDDNSHVLHGTAALAFPVIAAVSITLLFFFLRSIGIIFTAFSTISGFFALLFVAWPFAFWLVRRFSHNVRNQSSLVSAFAVVPAAIIITVWLFTGNWMANNLIGFSLCILFASLCRVPNLKVTAILFTGLFFYDIFFVFFSERVFGRNVMVEVATTAPTNPASAIASWFKLPVSPVKTLALPAKLIIPTGKNSQAILGLGDIILPEVFLTYLLEFDLRNPSSPLYAGYFIPGLVAYAFALTVSFFCNYTFRAAQPALLYIVPAVLLTTILAAVPRGHLSVLWSGNFPSSRSEELDNEGSEEDRAYSRSTESYTLLGSKRNSDSAPNNV